MKPAADTEPTRFVLEFRTGPEILNYVNGADLAHYSQRGVVTPDHVIRTKAFPLLVPAPEADKLEDFADTARAAVTAYAARYDAMFTRQNARVGHIKTKLDAMPRVVLVPGVGLFGIGATARDAAIAADLAENTVRVITDAEAIGQFEALPEDDLFDVEYWSLEQAKLKSASAKPFTGQVAVVTGAGSGIGLATAKAFAAEGATVAALDIDKDAATASAQTIGGFGSTLRRDGSRKRAGGVRAGRPASSAASTSSCRMREQPGRAGSARFPTQCCAEASSSISLRTKRWPKRP